MNLLDDDDEAGIRELVKSQYFKQSGMSEEMIKRKKAVRKSIAILNDKCEVVRT